MSLRILRLGLLLDNEDISVIPEWQAQCLKQMLALDSVKVEIGLILINSKAKFQENPKNTFWKKYQQKKLSRRSKTLWQNDLKDILSNTTIIKCNTKQIEKHDLFDPTDLAVIRQHKLDIILAFDSDNLDGDILKIPTYGVWSFSYRLPDKMEGGPVGFWEIYNRELISSAVLQRVAAKERRIVLYKGDFPTIKYSLINNMDMLYFESAKWPAYVCRDIARGKAEYLNTGIVETKPSLYLQPDNLQMLLFHLKVFRNRIDNSLKNLLWHEHWNVGVVNKPIYSFLEHNATPEIQWLPDPDRNLFIADPFVFESDGEPILAVEGFDYRTRKGWISTLKKQPDNSFSDDQKTIELPGVHLSFPYPVIYKGVTYLVPETYQAGEVALYKQETASGRFRKVHTLLENFAAVDNTVFEYEGLWWLLCTERDGGIGADSRLFGWFASDLFGEWTAHPANPLKIDVRSSRAAGTPFIHEGKLYRPTQDCSRTYGGAVTINQVLRLTTEEFHEEPAFHIEPYDKVYRDGFHTISSAGDFTVVDGKRTVFVPAAMKAELKQIMLRRFKR